MIGHHVAKRARSFVKAATVLDADGFGRGDLHVVNVVAIPERLDDVVGKAEDHDVLHGLFAEIVIDAVDLLLSDSTGPASVRWAKRSAEPLPDKRIGCPECCGVYRLR